MTRRCFAGRRRSTGPVPAGRPVLLRLHVARLERFRARLAAPAAGRCGRASRSRSPRPPGRTKGRSGSSGPGGRCSPRSPRCRRGSPSCGHAAASPGVVTVRSHDTCGPRPASRRRATRRRSPRSPRPSSAARTTPSTSARTRRCSKGTMSNVWWREEDVLVTPALSTGVLPGVTRGAVVAIARRAGYRLPRRSVPASGAARCRRGLREPAVREIIPVIAVDGRELRRGEAAARLQALLEEVTDEYPSGDGQGD